MSVRNYAILYGGVRRVSSGGGAVGGGNTLLATEQHALDGAEHTGQLPDTRLSTTETDTALVLHPDGLGGLEWGVDATGAASALYPSITDYGAAVDDTTDDTAAVQDAIDDTPEFGTLWVPGIAKITDTIAVPRSIRLLGPGMYPGFGLTSQRAGLRMATVNKTALSSTVVGARLSLEYLGIIGPTGNSSGRGIYSTSDVFLWNAQVNGFFDNVYIDDSGGTPSAFYTQLLSSWINFADHASVVLHGAVNNALIRGCHLSDGAIGIVHDGGGYGIKIVGNSIELFTTGGITIDGSGGGQVTSGLEIKDNYFEQGVVSGSPTYDVLIGPTTTVEDFTIEGNTMVASQSASLWHIDVNHGARGKIGGNAIGVNSEAGSIRGNATNATNLVLEGVPAGLLSLPASTRIIDPATDVTPASVGGANAVGTSKYLARADHVHEGSAGATALDDLTDVTITSAVEGELIRWNGAAWVNDAGYIPIDTGTPTYDTGSPPGVTMATKWGLDTGMPYYDTAGADAGEEAALFYDPLTAHYFLIAYDF